MQVPSATRLVIGCQHEAEARQLLVALKDRLAQFGLSLHESKTRLIEFGRFAPERRAAAGQRRPETFDFLGFTHYCGRTRSGRFVVKRKTQAKRMVRKLKAVRQDCCNGCTPLCGSSIVGSARSYEVTTGTTA